MLYGYTRVVGIVDLKWRILVSFNRTSHLIVTFYSNRQEGKYSRKITFDFDRYALA